MLMLPPIEFMLYYIIKMKQSKNVENKKIIINKKNNNYCKFASGFFKTRITESPRKNIFEI